MKHSTSRSTTLFVLGILLVLLAGLVFAMRGNAGDGRAPAGQAVGQQWVRPRHGAAMVYVPGGSFPMGATESDVDGEMAVCNKYHAGCHICNPGRDICHRQWFDDQQPAHDVALDSFWLDRTEVTNRQYARCVRAGRCTPPRNTGLYTRAGYYDDPMYADTP
jgi:formylglycine-generating enzyme required for sulfatase activity